MCLNVASVDVGALSELIHDKSRRNVLLGSKVRCEKNSEKKERILKETKREKKWKNWNGGSGRLRCTLDGEASFVVFGCCAFWDILFVCMLGSIETTSLLMWTSEEITWRKKCEQSCFCVTFNKIKISEKNKREMAVGRAKWNHQNYKSNWNKMGKRKSKQIQKPEQW